MSPRLSEKKAILRIIDANFNRAREGLRVCEEVARFILNSGPLTDEIKTLRHEISGILRQHLRDGRMLYRSRDSGNDVGKGVLAGRELSRAGIVDIFSANMERAKESLRVLEEFFKLIDRDGSEKFLILRFKAYGIEKKGIKRFVSLHHTG
jgi:thiamine-phosphate pyrophosphorylase